MKIELLSSSSRRKNENKDAVENYANTWHRYRKHRPSACRMVTITSFTSVVIIFESVHVSANTLNLENERLKCIYLAKKGHTKRPPIIPKMHIHGVCCFWSALFSWQVSVSISIRSEDQITTMWSSRLRPG